MRGPSPYYDAETVQAFQSLLGYCKPPKWDCIRSEFQQADIEFLDGKLKRELLSATDVYQSGEGEVPVQFDPLNPDGGTKIKITEAHLSHEQFGDMGKTIYIELLRPNNNHHLVEIRWPNEDIEGEVKQGMEISVYDSQRELPRSELTDNIIEGLIRWGDYAEANYQEL